MPTIFAANESSVSVGGEPIEGVHSIEYRYNQVRENIYALGSSERVGITSGPMSVEGRLVVASTNRNLDALKGDSPFQIIATLKQGTLAMTVTFSECFLLEKSFSMGVGGHGQATYDFSAIRVEEKIESQ